MIPDRQRRYRRRAEFAAHRCGVQAKRLGLRRFRHGEVATPRCRAQL